MVPFYLICCQVLTMAAGFQANTSHLVSVKRRSGTSPMILTLQHTSKKNADEVVDLHGISRNLDQLIRPVLVSTAAAVSIASMPMISSANAVDLSYPNSDIEAVMHSSSISASAHQSPITTSSLQLSSSTMAAPIGEMQDGSDTSVGTSFGQWFFLLYVVVSLLAGGKEVLSRIQKQMDKEV